jgi:archaellum component FlaC
MASLLDIKRKEAEYRRVDAAKFELELKVMEREEEIIRVKDNIKTQEKRLEEILKEIEELKKTLS